MDVPPIHSSILTGCMELQPSAFLPTYHQSMMLHVMRNVPQAASSILMAQVTFIIKYIYHDISVIKQNIAYE